MDNLQEKIAKRAYDLFMARGGQHGYHIADWLQAEKEMSKISSAPAAAPLKPAPVASKTTVAPAAVKAASAPAQAAPAPAAKKKVAAKK